MESTLQEVVPLVPTEVVLSVLGGVVITLVSGLFKGPLKKFNKQLVVAVISMAAGIGYYSFRTYIPINFQEHIVTFVWGSITASVFIYEFIWKNVKKIPSGLKLKLGKKK